VPEPALERDAPEQGLRYGTPQHSHVRSSAPPQGEPSQQQFSRGAAQSSSNSNSNSNSNNNAKQSRASSGANTRPGGESGGFGEQRSTLDSSKGSSGRTSATDNVMNQQRGSFDSTRSNGEISGMGNTGARTSRATGEGGDASRSFGEGFSMGGGSSRTRSDEAGRSGSGSGSGEFKATSGSGIGDSMNNYGRSDDKFGSPLSRAEEHHKSKNVGGREGDMQSRNISADMFMGQGMGGSQEFASKMDTKHSGAPGEGQARSSGDMRGQSDFGSAVRKTDPSEKKSERGASQYSSATSFDARNDVEKDFGQRQSNMGNASKLGTTSKK
jgi:hypothetical protein